MEKNKLIRWKTDTGKSIQAGDLTITPQSQALTIQFPGRWLGGFVWNRPTAVLVERDGVTERIPVIDATRAAQVGLLGLASAFAFILLIRSILRGGSNEGRF